MFKKLKNNPISHLTSVMWKHTGSDKKMIVLYSTAAVFAVLLSLCAPLAMAKVLQAVGKLDGEELLSTSSRYALLYGLIGLCFWIFHGPSRVLETVIAYRIRRRFQIALFRKVTLLPMSWQKEHHSGVTIDQISKASAALGEFTESGFEVIHILVRYLGAIAFLIWLMPAAGLVVVGFTIVTAVVIVLFDRKLVLLYAAFNHRLNQVAASIQDYLTNIGTVISLRLEDRVAREVDLRASTACATWKTASINCELKWFSTSMLIDTMHVTVLIGYIFLSLRSNAALEVASVYALSEYLRNIAESFFRFTGKYGDLLTKSTRLRATEHIEQSYDEEVKEHLGFGLPTGWKKLEILNLSFSHSGSEDAERSATIDDVSLILERGKSYALVGESGSGKSTLLKLLRGLSTAQCGSVICDEDVMPHGLIQVAHCTTLIPQEPEIFSNTIRFNVSMGVESSDEDILEALDKARFTAVLSKLPKGLDTNIAEKGVSLSGGERQRLAVARGFFFVKDSGSDIVLLDEPTSSVDIFNERLIYQRLLKDYKSHCIVTAIHKFNLLHLFDEVLVFAQGKIVERGKVDSLLALNGEFLRLWKSYSDEVLGEVG